MNIVVEGPDGAGKTTLCKLLSKELGRKVIGGEGPSKYMGELDERILRLSSHQHVIFDRHPAISGPIYNQFKEGSQDYPDLRTLMAFYGSRPFLLYCHPTEQSQHMADNSEVDTPAYLEWLEKNDANIRRAYERWALMYADAIYRIGDNTEKLVKMLRSVP